VKLKVQVVCGGNSSKKTAIKLEVKTETVLDAEGGENDMEIMNWLREQQQIYNYEVHIG